MPTSMLTKQAIANGLKDLMQTAPLHNISVGDITAHCGISRNTFYYHFEDKFHLVNWIFNYEVVPYIQDYREQNNWLEGLLALLNHMRQDKAFYMNALEVQGQNSLLQCLESYYQKLFEEILFEITDSAKEASWNARFYVHAMTGTILDWSRLGMKETPEKIVCGIQKAINSGIPNRACINA